MKDFFVNLLEIWEDLNWVERSGIIALLIVFLAFVALCIVLPVVLVITLIFASAIGVLVLVVIGISTIIDRI